MSKNQVVIALASDHAGFDLKQQIIKFLENKNYELIDLGPDSDDGVDDFPDFGFALADVIASDKAELGIAICGSGIGISIAVNRNSKVRAAPCSSVELAETARQHNNANVLALGARFISEEEALKCVEKFLETEFEGGRHVRRVEKLGEYKQDDK